MAEKRYEMDMCSGPLLSKILAFTLPLVLSSVLQLLFNAADVVVVGRFAGSTALAAVGSTGSLINLIVNLFMGLSVGVSVVVARHYGAQQYADVNTAVHTAMLMSLIGGAMSGILGFLLAYPLLQLMGSPAFMSASISSACRLPWFTISAAPSCAPWVIPGAPSITSALQACSMYS